MKRVLIIFSVFLFFMLILHNIKLFGQESELEMSFSGDYVYFIQYVQINENVEEPRLVIDTIAKILMDGSFKQIKDYPEAQSGLIKTIETHKPAVVVLQDSIKLEFDWWTGMIAIENFSRKAIIFITDEIIVAKIIPIGSSAYSDWFSYAILIFLLLILFLFSRACKHRNWRWIFQNEDYAVYHKLLSWIFISAWACLLIACVIVSLMYLFGDYHSSFYTATFVTVYVFLSILWILITTIVLITHWIKKRKPKQGVPESSKRYPGIAFRYFLAIALFSLPLILIDFWTLVFPIVLILIGITIRAKYKNII